MNAELIKALRHCAKGGDIAKRCLPCGYYDREPWCESALATDAADALEAADAKIVKLNTKCADLQSQIYSMENEIEELLPKEGEWIEKWRFKTDGTPFHKIGDMECSVCHGEMLGRFYSKYCPHCGALLRGEHDERTDKA